MSKLMRSLVAFKSNQHQQKNCQGGESRPAAKCEREESRVFKRAAAERAFEAAEQEGGAVEGAHHQLQAEE